MPRLDLSLKLELMVNVRFQVSGFATRWRAVSLRSPINPKFVKD